MINISNYLSAPDLLEFYLNPASVDLISITKNKKIGKDDRPIYNSKLQNIKMMVSGMPIELVMSVKEADDFLTYFNLERRK